MFTMNQGLRSSSKLRQSWQGHRAAFATQPALELIHAEMPCLSLPLQYAKGHEAASDVMELRPRGARLTAGSAELIFANPDDFLHVSTEARQSAHRRSQQRQAIRRIVLGAISDDQDFEVACQPPTGYPVGLTAIRTNRLAVEPAVLLEPTDQIPPIIANPLQQGFRRIPRLKEDICGATVEAIAGRAQAL
jgi:hypothetical protein